ncbi:MAG: dihydrolipoamide acetyltransferase family protein [Phycisphaerae bacterium]|nr:dihydrolipoamide acetyltransferase family protein [Phycisphaerae bacterium]MDD5381179.1 dihydrolipoamide acetyltransferase family protein [Phycisphaerae bacterium]
MAKEIRLPQFGQTMEEGTIVDCPVKIGDEVRKGDCVFEIEIDKTTLEMESPADGFVKYILVEVGRTVPVGEPLIVLGGKDEKVPHSFLDSLKTAVAAKPATQPVYAPAATAGTPDIKAEVKVGKIIPLTKKQKLIADRMLKSKRELPCFYLTARADVTAMVELRDQLNKSADMKITYNDFIIKAVATGLQKFPLMTGQLAGNAINLPPSINIGLAVSTPDGLVVPVIKDVQKKNIMQIAADSAALIEKARNEKLLLTDLEGACITISNLGAFGIYSFIPIVIPGQCSILGIGQTTNVCVPDNGNVSIRKLMNMTLSVDHKIANGAYAAQFLDFTRKLLEDTSTFA